ncbi:epimerase [Sphingobacterium faecale]|uniref:NAD-dependent epimerase/dehydratase domain-containing protein n=1 Tax=Sphingobacterium faecale TaxID=2803775 RepID=A0ABS1R7E0_9SPHI|nr:NAD-dependent epimerase/dehydratase family protein [Sphingobacterium faecale]MBL1410645.1 hypothetical protein [Sphingobacterium faecale]
MKKVVLAGGSGHLGRLLAELFIKAGMKVVVFSRSKVDKAMEKVDYVYWDGETLGDWVGELEDTDTLINLCGKSIQCRFTKENQQALTNSRVVPTKLLGEALRSLKRPPRLWINFSGISIFGGKETLHAEDSTDYGIDFLSVLAQEWEAAFVDIPLQNTRKVILRISPVLSKGSGMFAELYPLVKMGLGGKVGDGKQMVSWIHEHDFVQMVKWVAELEEPAPVYHACSSDTRSNKDFMRVFREEAKISLGLPVPVFMAYVGSFLKGVDVSLLLQTVPATTKQTIEDGFKFKYNYLHSALAQLIKST